MFDHVAFGVTDLAASTSLYCGAFVIGPDGHNIEAVCHRPES